MALQYLMLALQLFSIPHVGPVGTLVDDSKYLCAMVLLAALRHYGTSL